MKKPKSKISQVELESSSPYAEQYRELKNCYVTLPESLDKEGLSKLFRLAAQIQGERDIASRILATAKRIFRVRERRYHLRRDFFLRTDKKIQELKNQQLQLSSANEKCSEELEALQQITELKEVAEEIMWNISNCANALRDQIEIVREQIIIGEIPRNVFKERKAGWSDNF